MLTLNCTNPACRKKVRLPDSVPVGKVYGCPDCGQALPPVPAVPPQPDDVPEAAPEWALCLTLSALVAVLHLVLFLNADSAIKQSAISAAAGAWTVSLYVLARSIHQCRRENRPKG